jgi:hypothetical protein
MIIIQMVHFIPNEFINEYEFNKTNATIEF